MSGLYVMRYNGLADTGAGAIYIGKGKVVGVDIGGGEYHGTYTEAGGRIKASITFTVGDGGLVTGQPVAKGTKIPIVADWPITFADGQLHPVMVSGRPVQVQFQKIGDIP